VRHVTIAAAAYPLDWLDDWAAYEAKTRAWVEQAARRKADLLVFPEYAAMEIASLGGAEVAADLHLAVREVLHHRDAMERHFEGMAIEFGLYILGPSGPAREGDALRNRAVLFGPSGRIGHQDKAIMTRFEREDWAIGPGQGLTLFDTGIGKIGVVICYDSEFPLLSRALCEAGAEILLSPSCTEALEGYNRVRIGTQARALENQCVTVQAPIVGRARWCPPVEENHGAAGIYGPPDAGWPADGVLAMGALDAPGWVVATVDLDLVGQSRRDGSVLLFQHWREQPLQAAQVRSVAESPRKS